MIPSIGQKGCSNRVEMQLLVNGTSLPIAQMGPDFLLLDKTLDHPPGEATIVFSVEGSDERRWQVRLPEGLVAGRERVVIAKA
jgi:hypothetical protein